MYVTPSGKMGSCSWGMADLARHERQNTAYPPQTAHSQNPSDSAKCRPPNRLSFLCKILIRQLICPPWALQPRPKTSGALKVARAHGCSTGTTRRLSLTGLELRFTSALPEF